jgi:hypothetical protein
MALTNRIETNCHGPREHLDPSFGARVVQSEAADLVAGDVDTVLMWFGEGDLTSVAASLTE